jgi:hypothetical protein
MGITYGDYLIDSGYYDPTAEQEQEAESGEFDARDECKRRGIDPDAICPDEGCANWLIVEQELSRLAFDRKALQPQSDNSEEPF